MINKVEEFKSYSNSSDIINYFILNPYWDSYIKFISSIPGIPNSKYYSDGVSGFISGLFNVYSLENGPKRCIVYCKDYIVKLPLHIDYVKYNLKELCLYNFISNRFPDLLQYLCPIVNSNSFLYAMPRCEIINTDNNTELGIKILSELSNIKSKFLSHGIRLRNLDRLDQLGFYKGKLVILYYGDYNIFDNVLPTSNNFDL